VVWIGQGRQLATRGRRGPATPVTVLKGALADNVPHRDLRITKAHALFLDGVLIPVEFLVNHRSIRWDDHAQEVLLYHVELESHDVLLANGAPAESYRDDGNRWLFQNANTGWDRPPQPPCAPVLTGGPVVDALWRHLLHRTGGRPGWVLTDEPDLHLVADGRRIDPSDRYGAAYRFHLAGPVRSVRLCSRAAAPQELGTLRDPRQLGVAVARVTAWQGDRSRVAAAGDPRFQDGFHPPEAGSDGQWTNGDARLPETLFAGPAGAWELVVHLTGRAFYPLLTDDQRRIA
jgi:hypothetical protein